LVLAGEIHTPCKLRSRTYNSQLPSSYQTHFRKRAVRDWKSKDPDPLAARDSMFDPAESHFDPAPERDGHLTAEELHLRMQAQVMANNLQLQSGKYGF